MHLRMGVFLLSSLHLGVGPSKTSIFAPEKKKWIIGRGSFPLQPKFRGELASCSFFWEGTRTKLGCDFCLRFHGANGCGKVYRTRFPNLNKKYNLGWWLLLGWWGLAPKGFVNRDYNKTLQGSIWTHSWFCLFQIIFFFHQPGFFWEIRGCPVLSQVRLL